MASPIRTLETRDQAFRRLLAVARESGIRLLHDQEGRFYATSASEPDLLHPVAPDSCSCRGFATHRRCRHVTALLAHLGRLDPDPPAASGMRITCAHVDGYYGLEAEPEWHEPRTELLVDGEVKVRVLGDASELSVHWMEGGRPVDDITGCTPAFLSHGGVVDYWLRALGAPAPVDAVLQEAGIGDNAEYRDQPEEAANLLAA